MEIKRINGLFKRNKIILSILKYFRDIKILLIVSIIIMLVLLSSLFIFNIFIIFIVSSSLIFLFNIYLFIFSVVHFIRRKDVILYIPIFIATIINLSIFLPMLYEKGIYFYLNFYIIKLLLVPYTRLLESLGCSIECGWGAYGHLSLIVPMLILILCIFITFILQNKLINKDR